MNHRSLKKKNPDDCPKKSSEENGTPEEKVENISELIFHNNQLRVAGL